MQITIKLLAGLDIDVHIPGYDPLKGVCLEIPPGYRLLALIKQLEFPDQGRRIIYFVNGTRVGLWKKLKDGDEIVCLRPLAGG